MAVLAVAGTCLVSAGVVVGKVTRSAIQTYFSYVVPERIIRIETLPFFAAGGVLIAIALFSIIANGDRTKERLDLNSDELH